MWKTVWPASAFVLKTVRNPPSAYPFSRAMSGCAAHHLADDPVVVRGESVQALDVLAVER